MPYIFLFFIVTPMKRILLLVAPLAACAAEPVPMPQLTPRQVACRDAETNLQKYGTPSNLGPCVGSTIQRTDAPGQLILVFNNVRTGRPAAVHWMGGRIFSVTE